MVWNFSSNSAVTVSALEQGGQFSSFLDEPSALKEVVLSVGTKGLQHQISSRISEQVLSLVFFQLLLAKHSPRTARSRTRGLQLVLT